MRCAVLGAPPGLALGLPAESAAEPELVLAFARDRAGLAAVGVLALALYRRGGRLWFAYPKLSGRLRGDLARDHGWGPVTAGGLLPVTQVSVDADWSALRFRHRDEMPRLARRLPAPD